MVLLSHNGMFNLLESDEVDHRLLILGDPIGADDVVLA
jgi:hypothetical protein